MADATKRYYVYRFTDENGKVMYIGKGTGRRLKTQEARFGRSGEIVREFRNEKAAYEFERRQIACFTPYLNKIAGGGGSIARAAAKLPAWFRRIEKEIEAVGSRVYAARELLKLDLRGHVSPEQIAVLRQVAASA